MNGSVVFDESYIQPIVGASEAFHFDIQSFKHILFSVAALLLIGVYHLKSNLSSPYFRNAQGKHIVEVKGESRFKRFADGSGLSEEGHAKAHGDPFVVWNGWTREVVLSSPEQTRDFYQGDAKDHVKPPALNMGHYFERILGSSAGVQNGDQWKTTRSHFDPSFSHSAAATFISTFSKEIQAWLQNLAATGSNPLGKSGVFESDAVKACRILPFKLVSYACYGELLTEESFQELLALNTTHEKLMSQAIFGKSTVSKWVGALPTYHKRQMDQFQKDWEAFNMGMIEKARTTGKTGPIAQIYANTYPNSSMTKQEWLQTIDEILFTNIDVTSCVLAFLLMNVAATAPVQEQLREEIKSHLSSGTFEDLESYIAKSGTLLEYTYMESIRLCPATWFSLPEYSPQTKRVGGYLIPAKTPFIIDWKRLNTQSPVWNPAPKPGQKPEERVTGTTFSPSRFATLSPSQYRYSFLRYGLGPRKCIGKNFAAVIMKIMLIEVLGLYRLEFPEEDKKKGQDRDFEIRDDCFTITPKQVVRFSKLE